MFKFIDIKQNTDEWLNLRVGKLTSSKLGVVMSNYGKAFGEPAKKYAVNIAIEQITGNRIINESYSNSHIERGHQQEPVARMLYEDDYFCDVSNGGFFDSDFVGCSPDGLVGDEGLIEIKSVISSVQYANVKRQSIDPAYKWQCIGNLKFSGRDWIDFVSFCEDFPDGKKLYVCRTYKDQVADEFEMIDRRICEFRRLVDETKKTIEESNYTLM
jgi:hypothetical protein